MVDVLRMPALRRAIPERAARLIVGDIDQLPSGELCLGVHDATRLRNQRWTPSAGQLIDVAKWNLLRYIPVKMRGAEDDKEETAKPFASL